MIILSFFINLLFYYIPDELAGAFPDDELGLF